MGSLRSDLSCFATERLTTRRRVLSESLDVEMGPRRVPAPELDLLLIQTYTYEECLLGIYHPHGYAVIVMPLSGISKYASCPEPV